MLAKVINIKKSGLVSAKKVLAYLGRDQLDQADELAQFGPPQMGTINDDGLINSPEDRETMAEYWDGLTRSSGSKSNPLYHVSINWQEGEHPTAEQAEKACMHVMKALGFDECTAAWALHKDTDNDHVHLVVNRVSPTSPHKVVPVPGWDFLTLDKSMRELEIEQGWAHSNGPWIAIDVEGKTEIIRMSRAERRKRGLLQEGDSVKLTQAAIRAELNTTEESFQRWVSKDPARVLKNVLETAPTWQKVHDAMAEQGLQLTPKGSGMVVTTTLANGQVMAAKASQLGRFATKSNLEKVLGPYIPPAAATKIRSGRYEDSLMPREGPVSDEQRLLRRKERAEAREELLKRYKAEQIAIKEERKGLRLTLKAAHLEERGQMALRNKVQRLAVRANARKQGVNISVALSLWAFDAAKEREAMQQRHAKERDALNPKVKRTEVFRDWLEKNALHGDEAAQAALRGIKYREQREKKKLQAAIEGEEIEDVLHKMTLTGLSAEIDAKRQRVIYKSTAGVKKFTDTGPRIEMHDKSANSLEAALRLAAQKYGGRVELTGSAEFRIRAASMANQLGIKVVNADLQNIGRNSGQAVPQQRGGQRNKKDPGMSR